jgi:hypothetical protein
MIRNVASSRNIVSVCTRIFSRLLAVLTEVFRVVSHIHYKIALMYQKAATNASYQIVTIHRIHLVSVDGI